MIGYIPYVSSTSYSAILHRHYKHYTQASLLRLKSWPNLQDLDCVKKCFMCQVTCFSSRLWNNLIFVYWGFLFLRTMGCRLLRLPRHMSGFTAISHGEFSTSHPLSVYLYASSSSICGKFHLSWCVIYPPKEQMEEKTRDSWLDGFNGSMMHCNILLIGSVRWKIPWGKRTM